MNGTAPRQKTQTDFRKGDLVKQRASGGHVMTVTEVSRDGKAVIGSYTTPDGQRHDETWQAALLKHVAV